MAQSNESSSTASSAPLAISPSIFYFQAEGVPARELALAISEHYGVSVLVHGDVAERLVSGRVVTGKLSEAVEALSFLLGVKYRLQGDRMWLVGGRAEKTIAQFPSYGLTGPEIQPLTKDGGGLVAGRVVIESDETRVGEVRELLNTFSNRPSLTLELFMLSVSEDKVQRVNDWLETLKLGAAYFQDTTLPNLGPAFGDVRGFNYLVDAKVLLEFVRVNTGLNVELRQQVQVMSGGRSLFNSGDVVTETSYTTVPGAVGSQQLVSRIDRRTVGLVLQLGAVEAAGNWFCTIRVEDSNLSGDSERTTSYEGERFIRGDDRSYFLLASFTRKSVLETKDGFRLFPKLAKRSTSNASRSLMLLARKVGS